MLEKCNRCERDVSQLFVATEDSIAEDKVEYDVEKDLLVCEECYDKEIIFSTIQKQRRISNPQQKAYIIYEAKNTSPENLARLSISSSSNPSGVARKRMSELEKENAELRQKLKEVEEKLKQLQPQQEQLPK